MIDVIEFKSDKSGPTIGFIGGVHGNETCGVIAVNKLIEAINSGEIALLKGRLLCLPKANPKAFDEAKRYCEVNLNRVFKEISEPLKYEEKLAQEIIKMIKECEAIVDLHSNHTNSAPFIFQDVVDDRTTMLVNSMPVENIVYGWNDLYDATGDAASIDCAYAQGGYGITVECGGHDDALAPMVGYDCLISALVHYGMIEVKNKNSNLADKQILKLHEIVKKPKGGEFSKQWKHGDVLKKDEVIGYDGLGNSYLAVKDSFICLPYAEAAQGDEWYYLAEPVV